MLMVLTAVYGPGYGPGYGGGNSWSSAQARAQVGIKQQLQLLLPVSDVVTAATFAKRWIVAQSTTQLGPFSSNNVHHQQQLIPYHFYCIFVSVALALCSNMLLAAQTLHSFPAAGKVKASPCQ